MESAAWPDTYTVALDDTAQGDYETQRRIKCFIGEYEPSGESVGERKSYRHVSGVAKLYWCENLPDGWFSSAAGWCFECDQAGGAKGDGKEQPRVWAKVPKDAVPTNALPANGIKPPSSGWRVEASPAWGGKEEGAPVVVTGNFAAAVVEPPNVESPIGSGAAGVAEGASKASATVSKFVGGIKEKAGQMSPEQLKVIVRDAHAKHIPAAKEKAAQLHNHSKEYMADAQNRCYEFWTHPDTVDCIKCSAQVAKDLVLAAGSCVWTIITAAAEAACGEQESKPHTDTTRPVGQNFTEARPEESNRQVEPHLTDTVVVSKGEHIGEHAAVVHDDGSGSLLIVDGPGQSAFACFSNSAAELGIQEWQALSSEERAAWDERAKAEAWGNAAPETEKHADVAHPGVATPAPAPETEKHAVA